MAGLRVIETTKTTQPVIALGLSSCWSEPAPAFPHQKFHTFQVHPIWGGYSCDNIYMQILLPLVKACTGLPDKFDRVT